MIFHIIKYMVLIIFAAAISVLVHDVYITYLMYFVVLMAMFLMFAGMMASSAPKY
jgi:hypothetical protein